MSSLAQSLMFSPLQGSGQSPISPLVMQLAQQPTRHPLELLGKLAMVGVDNWGRSKKNEEGADSIAAMLMPDASKQWGNVRAAAGMSGGGGQRRNQIAEMLASNPELMPFAQSAAMAQQFPELFGEAQNLQQIWDQDTQQWVWGTPEAGAVAKPSESGWQSVGGGMLMREGAGGQLEFQRIPGTGGGGKSPWKLAEINGADYWVNEQTQEIRAVAGAAPAPSGPGGGSTEERYWWTINNADPASREYAAAYYELFQRPKYVQTNDGAVPVYDPVPQGIQPPASGGATPPTPQTGQPSGQPQLGGGRLDTTAPATTPPPATPTAGDPIGGTKKGSTGESAGRVAGMKVAQNSLNEAEELLFPGGVYDPGVAFSANMPIVGGTMPYSDEGKRAYTAIFQAVDAWLRASTGAAAPEEEIRRYVDAYMPGPFDPDTAAKYKLGKLRELIQQVETEMQPNAPATGGGDTLTYDPVKGDWE